jgi:hypothetical protein
MADYLLFRDIAKAMAVGDGDRAAELIGNIDDAEMHEYHTYITAVFAAAVAHYFKDDSSPEAIRRFVDGMRHDYRKANPPLQALTMEGLLRAFFGEEHLMDEIDPNEQLRCEFLAIRKMVFDNDELRLGLDKLVADAEAMAREWLTDAT